MGRAMVGSVAILVLGQCMLGLDSWSQPATGPGDRLAPLLSGMGVYSRPISTDSILAQRYFDQGLNLTFGYYFVHAVASFQEGLRHDPDNAMLYWGMALAIGPTPNSRYIRLPDDPEGEGKRAIEEAMRLRKSESPVEQAMIEALHIRYDTATYPDQSRRDRAYVDAVREIYEQYPTDLEAGFLLADAIMTIGRWTYWDADGKPLPGTEEAARALERTVELHPLHPGANHLYIHLIEASDEPDRATPHADRLAALSPHVGHVVHMPSHIYIRTARYADAIATNERSVEVDAILLEEWGDHPFPMICTYNVSAKAHTGHATDFIRLGATFQGNYTQAAEYARITAGLMPMEVALERNQRQIATVWLVHKIFGKWDALEEENAPPKNYPYLQGIWEYAHGSKHVHRGEIQEAKAALERLRAHAKHPDIQTFPIRSNPGADVLSIAIDGLEGEIALAQSEFENAIRSFENAVAKVDALTYIEPPDWAQSMRLYLGNAHLKAGEPGKAESVFRDDLAYWPENGWALFGLAQSLEAQGKPKEAEQAQKEFQKAWKSADTELNAAVF